MYHFITLVWNVVDIRCGNFVGHFYNVLGVWFNCKESVVQATEEMVECLHALLHTQRHNRNVWSRTNYAKCDPKVSIAVGFALPNVYLILLIFFFRLVQGKRCSKAYLEFGSARQYSILTQSGPIQCGAF